MEFQNAWDQTLYEFNCDHENAGLRYRESCNQYVMQCPDCGWTGNAIAHSKLDDGEMRRAEPVDDSLREEWYQARRGRHQELVAEFEEQRLRQKAHRRGEWFKVYNEYMRSPEWKARRTEVFRRDGYVCQACLSNPATQVHHLTYDHWGNEPLFELVSVCKPCHERITEMDRNGNPGWTGIAELPY